MSVLTRWEPSTRWSPLKELEEMEKRLSTIFGRSPMATEGEKKEAISVTQWSPLVDITEDDKEWFKDQRGVQGWHADGASAEIRASEKESDRGEGFIVVIFKIGVSVMSGLL